MVIDSHFITFEGIDYCGKTTQIKKLEKYLKEKNIPIIVAREPGSTAIGGALRMIIKQPERTYSALNAAFNSYKDFTELLVDQKRTFESETLMFLAARAEFMTHIVKPNLEKGVSIIADRFADSTRAYQGGGRYSSDPDKINLVNTLNNFVLGGIWPERTFLLDICYEIMVKRAGNTKLDFIESLGTSFFNRVITEYRNIAKENPNRVILIDGTQPINKIFNEYIIPEIKKIYSF